ncbi:MAG TPA: hypothetical protein VFP31_04195 [Gaiellaceae bacterium]|nr:hypothetical protein [Gaiellaceae bacterium]
MRRSILVLAALLALGTGGTAALAASGAKEKPRAAVAVKAHGSLLQAAATYLDLDRKALARELRSGKSLAQVAGARNKSVAGLQTAILNAFKAKVDAAVAAGKLDATRAQKVLAAAPARIQKLVNRVPKARPAKAKAQLRGGFLKIAADYLDLDRKALVRELRSGKSLAQVATTKSKSVDGLEAAIFAGFKAKVDAAVAAGKLDATRAQKLLDRAPARIERLVNRARG